MHGSIDARWKRLAPGEAIQMFEQTFKNIDDVLWKEAGCSSELDYTEQSILQKAFAGQLTMEN